MAEAATLADVTKKLGDIETAVKSGGDDSATDRAKAAEETKEAAVKEDERTSIFQSISDKLNIFKGMKTDDKKAKGFFSSLLGGFKLGGLISGFGSLILTGLTSAFTSLAALFGPGMIKFFAKAGPWSLIIAGLALAIEDGITGYLKADEL